jgi:hypothetical protein
MLTKRLLHAVVHLRQKIFGTTNNNNNVGTDSKRLPPTQRLNFADGNREGNRRENDRNRNSQIDAYALPGKMNASLISIQTLSPIENAAWRVDRPCQCAGRGVRGRTGQVVAGRDADSDLV